MSNNKAREINSPLIEELINQTSPKELAKIDAEMSNNKQQTAVKLYTEEQLVNTVEAIRDYLKNYPEKFHESMIEKHLKNLTPIELPSDEEMSEYLNTLPFTKHLDDGQYNDGVIVGVEMGIGWMRDKIQGGNK
jgi:hypothetical protein